MNVPRYWAKAEGDTPPDFPAGPQIAVWGWSDESRTAAQRHAQQRLTELLDHLRHSHGWPKGYTAAGFRIVATDPLYEPASPKAEALMIALGVDPA